MNTTVDIYEKYKKQIDELTNVNPELGNFYKSEFLKKEAKRRGFKKGVKVSRSWTNRKIVNIQDNNFRLDDINTLLLYGYEIFKDGVWAEIIDEKAELKEEIKELRKKLKSLEEKL